MISQLARDLKILYNHEVVRVLHGASVNGGNRVRVETQCGAVFEGCGCIVTCPLGVLKAGTVHFEPTLQSGSKRQYRALDLGLKTRFVLVFDASFGQRKQTFLVVSMVEHQDVHTF